MNTVVNETYETEASEMNGADYQAAEVQWYLKHGAYTERIRTDKFGNPYVIGDTSWRRLTLHRPARIELIEGDMAEAVAEAMRK